MSAGGLACERCGSAVAPGEPFCGYCHFRLPDSIQMVRAVAPAPMVSARPVADENPVGAPPPATAATPAMVPPPGRRKRITALAAVVALAAVAVGATLIARRDSTVSASRYPEMITQPTQRWQHNFSGVLDWWTADRGSFYAVVAARSGVDLVALDIATGEQQWSTLLQPTGSIDFAIATALDDGVAVVFGQANDQTSRFALFNKAIGALKWSALVATRGARVFPAGFIVGVGQAGVPALQSIDHNAQRLGPSIPVDSFFVLGDGRLLIDNGGVLSVVDPHSLAAAGFEYHHGADGIGDVAATSDGGVIAAVDETVVGIASNGDERWSFDPGVGRILSLRAMRGTNVMVEGSRGLRVITATRSTVAAASDIRTGAFSVLQPGDPTDDIFTYVGQSESQVPVVVSILAVRDGTFREIGSLGGHVVPTVLAVGKVIYTWEGSPQVADAAPTVMTALDPLTAATRWELPIPQGAGVTFTPTGLALVDRGGTDSSSVTFYR